LSVFFWAVIFPAAGFLGDPDEQPRVLRIASTAGFLPTNDAARFVLAAGGLFGANFGPIVYLVSPTPGTPTWLFLAYFLVESICVAPIVLYIIRADSRHRAR
jgi:hypothetical protein